MGEWRMTLVSPDAPVKDAILAIQNSGYQIALVADTEDRLLGTVTDGDVRRALLKGVTMEHPVAEIANLDPHTAGQDMADQELLAILNRHVVRQLPLVSADGKLCGVAHIDLLKDRSARPGNPVVLMAGGLGRRLRPLTANTPKPLLSVGGKPLLEGILESFIQHGFQSYFISVNYLADTIVEHFGDGGRWDIDITYLRENEPLGTAGALRMLPARPELPVIIMNGDLITRVNFHDLLHYHEETGALGTMCVREYDMEVPFGVVDIDNGHIRAIDEKPVHRFFVNAGIYVISPEALDLIPAEGSFDMTGLFDAIVASGGQAAAFPIHEYWLDVGRSDDFERANDELKNGAVR